MLDDASSVEFLFFLTALLHWPVASRSLSSSDDCRFEIGMMAVSNWGFKVFSLVDGMELAKAGAVAEQFLRRTERLFYNVK